MTAAAGVALYINDRIDVALAVGADGVHLGGARWTSPPPRASRRGLALAVSAHAPAEVAALRAAAGDRIAFALLGPIHDTPSKRRVRRAARHRGHHRGGAHRICRSSRSAASAPSTCATLLAAGARGVACIRAVMAAPDPAVCRRSIL